MIQSGTLLGTFLHIAKPINILPQRRWRVYYQYQDRWIFREAGGVTDLSVYKKSCYVSCVEAILSLLY